MTVGASVTSTATSPPVYDGDRDCGNRRWVGGNRRWVARKPAVAGGWGPAMGGGWVDGGPWVGGPGGGGGTGPSVTVRPKRGSDQLEKQAAARPPLQQLDLALYIIDIEFTVVTGAHTVFCKSVILSGYSCGEQSHCQ